MSAKAIMVQGTMSGAGKSLLVAGLCRIFAQDGYRVVPFKSQNMALNSFICNDGAEIGRAQAMQAEAAGITPTADMNPILLKPTNDVGSQVIVGGRPIGNMAARDYFEFKTNLIPNIRAAYGRLANTHDIVVIEGAGSPAEINLKENDIVNMGMARMASSPVLLVGDIDCGGVFAQLIGTHMLLDDEERPYVKATIINKFRGDKTILDSGIDILRERMGIPVAGVVPYTELDIEEEDGFSGKFSTRTAAFLLDIAVVRLPHISNFTDLDALSAVEGIEVRYISRARDVGTPDLIVLPGTKSTIADMLWLRESGLEAAIQKASARGVAIFGICGGYQMLGLSIADPDGAEIEQGSAPVRGMGLLPVDTMFSADKRQIRSCGTVTHAAGIFEPLVGTPVEGYEIHMGRTTIALDAPTGTTAFLELAPAISATAVNPPDAFGGSSENAPTPAPSSAVALDSAAPTPDGCCLNNVYGTYLHGIFDSQPFTQALISALLSAKGLGTNAAAAIDMHAYKEHQYDKLASTLRTSLDMKLIYNILEAGI